MPDRVILKQRAGELRNHLTEAERALWFHLRRRNMGGARFLRQRIIDHYIVDFYAPSLRLAVEVDGGQHFEADGRGHDTRRDDWLKRQGITVLRYTNLEVLRQRDAVLADIERVVRRLWVHPPDASRRPPSFGRG